MATQRGCGDFEWQARIQFARAEHEVVSAVVVVVDSMSHDRCPTVAQTGHGVVGQRTQRMKGPLTCIVKMARGQWSRSWTLAPFDVVGRQGRARRSAVRSRRGCHLGCLVRPAQARWPRHIDDFIAYAVAAKSKDEAGKADAVDNLMAYAKTSGQFFADATGGKLPAGAVQKAFEGHIMTLAKAVDGFAVGDADAYDDLKTAAGHMSHSAEALAGGIVSATKMEGDPSDPAADLRANLTATLTEHVYLASIAVFTAYTAGAGSPAFEASTATLDKNSTELAAAVGSLSDSKTEKTFLEAWRSHISDFVDYAVASRGERPGRTDRSPEQPRRLHRRGRGTDLLHHQGRTAGGRGQRSTDRAREDARRCHRLTRRCAGEVVVRLPLPRHFGMADRSGAAGRPSDSTIGPAADRWSAHTLPSVRKVAVVFNPQSGTSDSMSALALDERLSELFEQRHVESVLQAFDPETIDSDLSALLADQPDALIVAGGDGTVTTVAEHMVGTGIPLGVLPAGTMNVFALDLGVPEDLEDALDAVLTASVRMIDVARVNGRLFLCSSALAMLPHLGRAREHAREASEWSRLRLWARSARLLRRYPRKRLWLRVDGQVHTVRTRAMVVTNNPLRSGPGRLHGRARLDAGWLAAYVAQDRTRWDLLGVAAKLLDGSWQNAKRVRTYQGRSVEISSSRSELSSVMNDGEVTQLTMPLRYEIQPRTLAVLAPGTSP